MNEKTNKAGFALHHPTVAMSLVTPPDTLDKNANINWINVQILFEKKSV